MSENQNQGYSAQLLRVDLSGAQTSKEVIEPATLRNYLGGCALGAKLLYDEVPLGIEFDDPRNRLMILAGPLSATRIAGSGGVTICALGALTGGAASTQAQGAFGAYLRLCGLMGLVFQGASEKWRYLLIDKNGKAELRDAAHLVGKDTWETVDAIVEELGERERDVSVMSIGPAGENKVRWASIMGDKGHAAAHNGVGAVMGSKKLKAVAIVRGKESVPVSDGAKLAEVAKAIIEPVISAESGVHHYGTLNGVQGNYARANLPIKNYQTNVWDVSEEEFEKFSGPYIHEHFQPRRENPCWGCPNRHCQMLTITEGPYQGMEVEEPEYEQFSAFSANLGINEVGSVMMLSNTVDRLGLDTNEAGWVCSCMMECYERGILTGVDTEGLEMTWGNTEAIREFLRRIANREGIGDIFAEGVRRAVQKIGAGAEEVGIYTLKGGTPRGHDHRARWSEMFDTCVSESGALENSLMVADLTQFGLPAEVDPFDHDMIAKAEGKMKGAMQFEDSMVTCRFNTKMNIERLSEAASAVTGWDITFDEAMKVGQRAVNIMRAFNIRRGITGDLDRPSQRYGSTPTDGAAQGKSIIPHFDKMLQDYYEVMGWDEAGKPLPETLRALGLDKIAEELQ
jgi:aldehyde:ferredoxin oxidoreductase